MWAEAFRRLRHNPAAVIGAIVLLLFVLVALIGPFLVPYSPTSTEWADQVKEGQNIIPGPSPEHWFGLDHNGRDEFSRVISWIGSFTAIQWHEDPTVSDGGQDYPEKVLRESHRNLRVWLQDGNNDQENNRYGSWPLANIRLANALKLKSYDFHFSFGEGPHSPVEGAAEFPEEMIWLWRDYDPAHTERVAALEARLHELLAPGAGTCRLGASRQIAALFIDLDGFKPVNDRYGHAAGDAVLVAVADRLRDSTRGSDVIARFGGDEFAVLLEVRDHGEVTRVAAHVARTGGSIDGPARDGPGR